MQKKLKKIKKNLFFIDFYDLEAIIIYIIKIFSLKILLVPRYHHHHHPANSIFSYLNPILASLHYYFHRTIGFHRQSQITCHHHPPHAHRGNKFIAVTKYLHPSFLHSVSSKLNFLSKLFADIFGCEFSIFST